MSQKTMLQKFIQKNLHLKRYAALTMLAGAFLLSGCAAIKTAIEHSDLEVQTKMSSTIFLEISDTLEKTIYVDIRNTSDKPINVSPAIQTALQKKGYTIVTKPKDAFYFLQGNILYVGEKSPSALQDQMAAGYGANGAGVATGAAVGILASRSGNRGEAAVAGAVVGGAIEVISGSLVENVTYSMLTDIQISERSSEIVAQTQESNLKQGESSSVKQSSSRQTNRKKYQTRILSSANQVNLDWEAARPALEEGLAKSISGIF